jgi:anti-sigma factor RsiW
MMVHIDDSLLNEFLDRQLDAATQKRVADHLAKCDDCRERLTEMEGLFAALAEMPEAPLMVDLSRQVVARLSAEFQPRPMPRWTFPVIALQLLVTLALFIWVWPAAQPVLETAGRTLAQAAGQLQPDFSMSEAVAPLVNTLENLSELGEAVGPNSPLPVLEGFLIIGLTLILWLAGSGLLLRQSLAVQNKS